MTKLAWRRTWFQVHKWIGLILAILIIPVCLTGSALVWHDGLDRLVNPGRYAVSGETLLGPDPYVTAARAVLKPGERVAQLTMPEDGGPVIVAAAQPPAKGPARGRPPRTNVYLDPPTARVLDIASSRSGLVQFLHVLHGSLQVPGVGRQIVGWIGVFLMVSSFTGLWLWWPTVGKWARGLRWRRHRNTDTNLHYLMGFCVALPLFMLSLTGAWISFPQFFAGLTGAGGGQPAGPPRGGPARPVQTPAQSVASVIERARVVNAGSVRSINFPTEQKADWLVAISGGEGARPVSVAVADDTGVAALSREAPRGTPTARLMRRLHDGTGMGIVWQVLIFIGGILPAVLAVTGVIMWWRARGWKAELAAKQAARREVVAAE